MTKEQLIRRIESAARAAVLRVFSEQRISEAFLKEVSGSMSPPRVSPDFRTYHDVKVVLTLTIPEPYSGEPGPQGNRHDRQ